QGGEEAPPPRQAVVPLQVDRQAALLPLEDEAARRAPLLGVEPVGDDETHDAVRPAGPEQPLPVRPVPRPPESPAEPLPEGRRARAGPRGVGGGGRATRRRTRRAGEGSAAQDASPFRTRSRSVRPHPARPSCSQSRARSSRARKPRKRRRTHSP